MKQFCVPEDLMNEINMAKGDHLELFTQQEIYVFSTTIVHPSIVKK